MLSIKGLSKTFGKVEAVKDLDLEVSSGEVFGLLGANGAGKTTTMRVLATMISPTAGNATINGFDLRKNPEDVRRSVDCCLAATRGCTNGSPHARTSCILQS